MSRWQPARRRIAFAALLAVSMAVSTWIIPMYSVLAVFLVDELGITRSQLGLLVTVAAVSTALLAPLSGRAVDALGGPMVLRLLLAASAAATLLLSLMPTYLALLGLSVFSGLANSASNPVTNKLIVDALEPGRRGVVMGVKQSGVQAGILLVGAGLPSAALLVGWRPAVAAATAVPLLALVVATRLAPPAGPSPGRQRDDGPYRHSADTRWLAAYALLMGAGTAATMAFLPLYAREVLGLSVAAAGLSVSLIGLVGIVTRVLWGKFGEAVSRVGTPLSLLSLGSMLAALLLWRSVAVGSWALWAGALLAGGTVVAWNAVAMLATVTQVASGHAGRASGLLQSGFMVGFTLAPVAFGAAVDATASYDAGWAGVTATFALAAALMAVYRRRPAGSPVTHRS